MSLSHVPWIAPSIIMTVMIAERSLKPKSTTQLWEFNSQFLHHTSGAKAPNRHARLLCRAAQLGKIHEFIVETWDERNCLWRFACCPMLCHILFQHCACNTTDWWYRYLKSCSSGWFKFAFVSHTFWYKSASSPGSHKSCFYIFNIQGHHRIYYIPVFRVVWCITVSHVATRLSLDSTVRFLVCCSMSFFLRFQIYGMVMESGFHGGFPTEKMWIILTPRGLVELEKEGYYTPWN